MDIDPVTEASRFAGRSIGPYEVQGLVGAGGMGEVYRAHDTRLDRTVAIKVLPRTLSTDQHARQRFVRETRVASRIVHPYVATVFDVVEDGPDLLLVMEYLEGRTLRQVLRDDRPDRSRILEIVTEITEALEAIHEAGIVHRDLKPGNVMIAPTGHVKVMDFGVARLVESSIAAEDQTLTRDGYQVGTVLYMSPEQVRGRKVDARSDLFALGGLLWEAITGEHPFFRDTVVATATAITGDPPGRGTEPPSLTDSGAIRDIVLRLLRKDPDERYPSATELLADLHAVARGERPSQTDFLAAMHRRRRNTVVATAFVAGAIATALIVAAVISSPWRDDGAPPGGVLADARPLLVVLPFDTPEAGIDPSSVMTSDLLASILGDGASVRTAPTWRVDELLTPLGADVPRSTRFQKVRDALGPTFILAGSIYREEGRLHASVDVVDGRTLVSIAPVRAEAERASELARSIATKIPDAAGLESEPRAARLLPDDDRALEAFLLARKHVRRLEWAAARQRLDWALGFEPDYLDARILLAAVLGEMGYERDALERVREADRMAAEIGLPEDAPQRLEAAVVEGRITAPKRRYEALQALARDRSDEPEVLLELAESAGEVGEAEQAERWLERAESLDPRDGRIPLTRATTIWEKRPDEAIDQLRVARDRFERDGIHAGLAEVEDARAAFLYNEGKLDEAAERYVIVEQLYEQVGLDVLAARARKFRADALLERQEFEQSRAVFESAEPVLREAGHYRALIRAKVTDGVYRQYFLGPLAGETPLVEALDDARALGLPDLELGPRINLAWIYSQTGRAEEALRLSEGASRIAGRLDREIRGRCRADELAGISVVESGMPAEGIRRLEAVALDEACPIRSRASTWEWIAWYRSVHEDPSNALVALDHALRMLDGDVAAAQQVGLTADRVRMLADLGRGDAARASMADAAELASSIETIGSSALASLDLAAAEMVVRLGEPVPLPTIRSNGRERFGPQARVRLLRSEGLLTGPDPSMSLDAAMEVIEDPWTAPASRAQARVVAARAELRRNDPAAAGALAAEALTAAERLELPLTEAWAAAVIAAVGAERTESGGRAQSALDRYLERVNAPDRDLVASRTDVIDLQALIASASNTSLPRSDATKGTGPTNGGN